jgi:hypothetical protein
MKMKDDEIIAEMIADLKNQPISDLKEDLLRHKDGAIGAIINCNHLNYRSVTEKFTGKHLTYECCDCGISFDFT